MSFHYPLTCIVSDKKSLSNFSCLLSMLGVSFSDWFQDFFLFVFQHFEDVMFIEVFSFPILVLVLVFICILLGSPLISWHSDLQFVVSP